MAQSWRLAYVPVAELFQMLTLRRSIASRKLTIREPCRTASITINLPLQRRKFTTRTSAIRSVACSRRRTNSVATRCQSASIASILRPMLLGHDYLNLGTLSWRRYHEWLVMENQLIASVGGMTRAIVPIVIRL